MPWDESLRRATAIVAAFWGLVPVVAQLVFVVALVPALPAVIVVDLAPRPFGSDMEWATRDLVSVGWAFAAAIAAIAVVVVALALSGRRGGEYGLLVVIVVAPVVAFVQLVNALVALTGGPGALVQLSVLVAIAAGFGSFFAIRGIAARLRRRGRSSASVAGDGSDQSP